MVESVEGDEDGEVADSAEGDEDGEVVDSAEGDKDGEMADSAEDDEDVDDKVPAVYVEAAKLATALVRDRVEAANAAAAEAEVATAAAEVVLLEAKVARAVERKKEDDDMKIMEECVANQRRKKVELKKLISLINTSSVSSVKRKAMEAQLEALASQPRAVKVAKRDAGLNLAKAVAVVASTASVLAWSVANLMKEGEDDDLKMLSASTNDDMKSAATAGVALMPAITSLQSMLNGDLGKGAEMKAALQGVMAVLPEAVNAAAAEGVAKGPANAMDSLRGAMEGSIAVLESMVNEDELRESMEAFVAAGLVAGRRGQVQ